MNGDRIIMGAIILCFVMLCWVLWKKQIIIILIRALMGAGVIWAINMLVPQGIQVGINVLSLTCAGILGVPGVMMVYIINMVIQ